ncbi:MAG: type II toxin-antitoxin system prevent-host-death family antitoxin [Defluviitaleaceae bacterium]|nr:type II toxin-antitoxin system prevent-host-death family antitoxin [Defluviitaleaceae bacterium]
MLKTQIRPSRDLRNHYAEVAKIVAESDHVIITNNGRGEMALINMDMFGRFEEFLHQQHIYSELRASKASLLDPNTVIHDAEDVFDSLEKRLTARGL